VLHNYLLTNIDSVFTYLDELEDTYPYGRYETRCFEVDEYIINYDRVIATLNNLYNYLDYTETMISNDEILNYDEFFSRDYTCNICFDTTVDYTVAAKVSLTCGHEFHKQCLTEHIQTNHKLCPMCRTELSINESAALSNEHVVPEGWIINPLTKRRVKVGSRTWHYLKDNNIIIT
jgi:hypothetical protein